MICMASCAHVCSKRACDVGLCMQRTSKRFEKFRLAMFIVLIIEFVENIYIYSEVRYEIKPSP